VITIFLKAEWVVVEQKLDASFGCVLNAAWPTFQPHYCSFRPQLCLGKPTKLGKYSRAKKSRIDKVVGYSDTRG
jgi:hypothetical protein